jgi:hypothetical protein
VIRPPVFGGFVTIKEPSASHSTIGNPIFSLNRKTLKNKQLTQVTSHKKILKNI